MEAVAATKPANVIELRPATTTQDKSEGHVISGTESQNGQFRGDGGAMAGQCRGVFGLEVLADLSERLEAEERQQAEMNAEAQKLLGFIFTNNDALTVIRTAVKEGDGDSKAYAAGIKVMVSTFEVGLPVPVAQLCEALSADTAISGKFLYKKVKPVLEALKLLIKKPDNTFRWATLEELQASPYATAKPATETAEAASGVQQNGIYRLMDCIGDAVLNPLAVANKPFIAIRRQQQKRRLAAAKKNPFAVVHTNGTIEYLSKPLEGELSEAEKQLIREAAKAEREGQLKAKIAAWKDKDAQTEWRSVQMQASQEQQALVQQFALQAAELRGRREVQREKIKGYLPIMLIAGVVAFVGVARYANDGQTDSGTYPALQATVSSPMEETVLPPMPMEAAEEQPATPPTAKGKRPAASGKGSNP